LKKEGFDGWDGMVDDAWEEYGPGEVLASNKIRFSG
tara:strand:+ start:1218 stop:1325 length:108 start_codon:yes stop_codon:yes gene_type:complete